MGPPAPAGQRPIASQPFPVMAVLPQPDGPGAPGAEHVNFIPSQTQRTAVAPVPYMLVWQEPTMAHRSPFCGSACGQVSIGGGGGAQFHVVFAPKPLQVQL